MRVFVRWVAAVALIPAVGAFAHGRGEAAFKCGSRRTAPGVVVVFNGKIVEDTAVKATDPSTIETISVKCSDARDSVFGVLPGRDLIVVFTAPGPLHAVKTSLNSIRVLQETRLEKKGKFATKLADLPWADPSGLITVSLDVTPDGKNWSATATHRYLTDTAPQMVSGQKR